MLPIVGIVGWHNSGKTTFAVRLVKALKQRGLCVAYVKHSRRGFALDHPGTDTWLLREAGTDLVVISSPDALGWMEKPQAELTLDEIIARVPPRVDLVIVEGFKTQPIPKIEVFRSQTSTEPIAPVEELLAIVSDGELDPRPVPQVRPDDVDEVLAILAGEGLIPAVGGC